MYISNSPLAEGEHRYFFTYYSRGHVGVEVHAINEEVATQKFTSAYPSIQRYKVAPDQAPEGVAIHDLLSDNSPSNEAAVDHLKTFIQAKIEEIKASDLFKQPAANVEINAPSALMQMSQEGALLAYNTILKEIEHYSNKE